MASHLLNPYALLAQIGVTLALLIGVWFYKGHVDNLGSVAAYAKQSAEAEKLRGDLLQANALKAIADLDYARQLDEKDANAQQQISDAAKSAGNAYAKQLRDILGRPRSGCTGTAQASDPGIVSQSDTSRIDGYISEVGSILGAIKGNSDSLKQTLALCREWALKNGR